MTATPTSGLGAPDDIRHQPQALGMPYSLLQRHGRSTRSQPRHGYSYARVLAQDLGVPVHDRDLPHETFNSGHRFAHGNSSETRGPNMK